jgi:hypothetical protein
MIFGAWGYRGLSGRRWRYEVAGLDYEGFRAVPGGVQSACSKLCHRTCHLFAVFTVSRSRKSTSLLAFALFISSRRVRVHAIPALHALLRRFW